MEGFITPEVKIVVGIGLAFFAVSVIARLCLPEDHWFNKVYNGRDGSGSGSDWGSGGGDGGD